MPPKFDIIDRLATEDERWLIYNLYERMERAEDADLKAQYFAVFVDLCTQLFAERIGHAQWREN